MIQGFPKTLIHPDHSPALISVGQAGSLSQQQSRGERFPPVVVHTEDQEARERARGYLMPGEARPQVDGYHAYPMMMEHPEFQPEVKEYMEGKRHDDGTFTTWLVPGKTGQFPPMTAKDETEEEALRAKGYVPGGHADGRAYQRAQAMVDMDYEPHEWPKYVNGVLMKDPVTPMRLDEYPKFVTPKNGGAAVTVASWEEECAVTGRGSSKNEPVKRSPVSEVVDPLYEEFLAWKAAQIAPPPLQTIELAETAKPEGHAQLVADAEALGIVIDKRWGDRRLKEEIEKALERSAAE